MPAPASRRWQLAPAALIAAATAAVATYSVSFPARYKLLAQEDGPIEWLTVMAFSAAAFMFARRAAAPVDTSPVAGSAAEGEGEDVGSSERRSEQQVARLLCIGLALLCVFVAGEEISWGQRLLGYQPPELFLARNAQQESNLHNLLKDLFDSRWQVFMLALAYGVLMPAAAWLRWLPASWAPPVAVMPAAALVVLLELLYPIELTGEVAEAVLGACFLHAAFASAAPRSDRAARRTLIALLVCTLAGALTPGLLDRLLYRAEPAELAAAHDELASLAAQLQSGGLTARARRRSRIHKRVYTAIRARYLSAPPTAPAALRRSYHLDPWQQPYWLLIEPGPDESSAVLLYSFGPNRRRDTVIEHVPQDARSLAGDDLGVALRVPPPATSASD